METKLLRAIASSAHPMVLQDPQDIDLFHALAQRGLVRGECYTTASGEQVVAVHGPTPTGGPCWPGELRERVRKRPAPCSPTQSRLRLTRPTPQHHARKAAKNSSSSVDLSNTASAPRRTQASRKSAVA